MATAENKATQTPAVPDDAAPAVPDDAAPSPGESRRLRALDRAIAAQGASQVLAGPSTAFNNRADEVLIVAKKFEAYLKGEVAE